MPQIAVYSTYNHSYAFQGLHLHLSSISNNIIGKSNFRNIIGALHMLKTFGLSQPRPLSTFKKAPIQFADRTSPNLK